MKKWFGKLKMNMKPIDKLTLVFVGTIFLAILGYFFAKYGIHNYEKKMLLFEEQSVVNYRVYLKKNSFFEESYLEENKTYIASLIDYLDIDFNYVMNFSDEVNGSYSYYIKGIITADKIGSSSDNYWKKEYRLSDTITQDYSEVSQIEIKENVKVNYQEYNDLLTLFKSEYGLLMDGNFKVMLVISNIVKNEITDEEVLKETNLELNIPLTSLTIEVPIETDEDAGEGVLIDEIVYDESNIYIVCRIVGYVFYTLSGILILYLIYLVILEIKKEGIYHRKIRKILKTYDSIIVSINDLPSLKKFNVINVNSFEELIDAHSEVRRPINFVEKASGSTFILISEGIAWVYTLNRELFTSLKEKDGKYHEKSV